ncbi:hypothetical protein ZIOFF_008971 [Zingiber officinale]|uniref:Polyprotein n=1 Tax=Zingiber officinale TaxID=94328 RepID=A0A8J5HEY6_ZINOF|nr:hypothetical protein ZIOFF_008971 [Zingiber officinale]
MLSLPLFKNYISCIPEATAETAALLPRLQVTVAEKRLLPSAETSEFPCGAGDVALGATLVVVITLVRGGGGRGNTLGGNSIGVDRDFGGFGPLTLRAYILAATASFPYCPTVSPLDSTAWLGVRIGSLLLGSSKVGMCARHAKQRVDKWQCAGTVRAQVEREVDLAVANRCKEADARNRSIWPSMARRNREPWHAAGACNAAYGRMQQNGLFRPKLAHGAEPWTAQGCRLALTWRQGSDEVAGSLGHHVGGATRRLNQVRNLTAAQDHELRERLSVVEALLGAVPDGEDVCDLVARFLNLEGSLLHIQESLMEEMAQRRKNNEDLRYKIIVLQRAMASSSEAVPQRPLVRVPEQKSFGGTRSAKELENFLWDMEQYFVAAKVPETEKVTISSMYLIGDAKLWWRTRMVDDANAGRQKIDTWDRLKKEMKDQFLPGNTSWIARDGLKRLKQSGSVRDYVKEFSSLMLDIQNMSEEDKLYNFLYGLQPWAQVELRRQNVRDLPSAIAAADALVDLRMSKENLNVSSSSKSNFVHKDKKGDWKKEGKKDAKMKDPGNNHGKGKAEHSAVRGKDNSKNQGCFLCNGPHFAKDCPKREKLNALLLGDQEDDYEQEVATLVNPLKLLNTIVAYEPLELLTNMSEDMVRAHSQLLHVSVMLNGKSAYAMVDTGATHTFVSAKLVQEFGLSVSKWPKYIKSVNAKAQAVVGMAYNVLLTVGTQVGKANMMVIPLEDFQIILGMDFLRKTKTVPMPHLDGVMVMQESNPCFVSAVHPYGKGQNKGKTNIISAISLEKGLRRGETTYLAALIDAKPDQNVELPVGVQDILKCKVRMDPKKVLAIVEWQTPSTIPELRSFLGLANYYRKFIAGYSKKAAPLTDLLKKNMRWEWSDACKEAFEKLKTAIASEPVLRLPDFELPFEVHTDASDRAIGGVLVQEGHPVAFESRKLNAAEQKYSAHEKEMVAVVHCLQVWRVYLLGTKFLVRTDNVANTFFATQKKLSPKQACWQEFLAEYDFAWEHKPGKHNQVADALSRKEVFATFYSISRVESDMMDRIKAVAASDTAYGKLVQQVRDGVIRRYWIEADLLVYKRGGGGVFVPAAGGLRKELLKETHDPLWAGHPGVERMLALLARSYIWPKMENDVETYVKTCLVCQQDKTERKKEAGLLQLLPIPEKPWVSVAMDFISGFPKVDDMSSIMVVVDRFSKYGIFIVAPSACPSDVAAELFYRHVVKFFGLPNDIQIIRRRTGKLRINHVLEEYLRHYVTASQKNWLGLLDSAQFCYNLHKSSATEKSPFEIVLGEQPTTPMEIAKQKSGGKCPAAYRYAREKQELLEEAQDSLRKATRRMKKYADKKRRPLEFSVGDEVHPTFHVSFLKKYHADDMDPSRSCAKRAPPVKDRILGAVERKTQVRGYMGKRCYFVAIREANPGILTEAIDEGVDFFWWGWFVSPLDSTAWLGARIGSLLLGSSKVGMCARHAKQRVDKWQCAGTVRAQVEREVDLAVANRCKEADARNRSIWPSMARRNREPWHAAGACNAAYGRMQQNGLFRPKPMEQNHGQHKGAGWL